VRKTLVAKQNWYHPIIEHFKRKSFDENKFCCAFLIVHPLATAFENQ
jgi:hypothetical protein